MKSNTIDLSEFKTIFINNNNANNLIPSEREGYGSTHSTAGNSFSSTKQEILKQKYLLDLKLRELNFQSHENLQKRLEVVKNRAKTLEKQNYQMQGYDADDYYSAPGQPNKWAEHIKSIQDELSMLSALDEKIQANYTPLSNLYIKEQIIALTSYHYKTLATGLPNSDIGIGQAGVFIHGNDKEKSALVSLKIKEGFKAYTETLNKIQSELQKKENDFNVKNFDFKNVQHITNLLDFMSYPTDNAPEDTAVNFCKIIDQIETLASNIISDKQPSLYLDKLDKAALLYFYVKVGFVLDILELNTELIACFKFSNKFALHPCKLGR